MLSTYTRNTIVIGLLAAVGPFAIDMYLPALPTIAAGVHASRSATQLTLVVFFVAFGLFQLGYGPWSDMVGRKPPVYVGLTLFIVGSAGCALAPDIGWLIALRAVQGIGAAASMAIPRAIIRDLHTGVEATRLMAFVMLVLSVSPILAPLAGSALIVVAGWRAIFAAVGLVAVISLVLIVVALPETRPREQRIPVKLGEVVGGFGQLMLDRRFLGLTFIGGLGMASFFSFLANSSFIYMDRYGLTPLQYGAAFSINAIGFIGASQLAAGLGTRWGMSRLVMLALPGHAAFALALLAVRLAGVDDFYVLAAMLFGVFAFLGLVIPLTMVLALDDHGPIAGLASALGGTLQMVTGGVAIAVGGLFFNGSSLPMVAAIATCALGALVLGLVTLDLRAPMHRPAE